MIFQNKTWSIVLSVLLFLILSLLIFLTVFFCINNAKITNAQNNILSAISNVTSIMASADTTEETRQILYTLGEKDGKLTIFASNTDTIIDILDTYIYSLPNKDREAINKGIAVYSVAELISLIEDYTS